LWWVLLVQCLRYALGNMFLSSNLVAKQLSIGPCIMNSLNMQHAAEESNPIKVAID
jgi:hypothetical protein